MRTKEILAAMLLALAPLPSVAQDFDAGMDAYNREDFAGALREWKPLAEQGNAFAQTNLGLLYQEGDGVLQDYAEAVRWFRAAADQGNGAAQTQLGFMYLYGRGVSQSNILAHMWLNISATTGWAFGQYGRQMVAERMTTADISEAHRLARVCVESNYQDCG